MSFTFSYLNIAQFVPSVDGLRLDFITSADALDVSTMTIPSEAQVGDVAVLFSYCRGLASTGGDVPSGWVKVADVTQGTSSTGIRSLVGYKIIESGEPGSSISGLIFGGQEEGHHLRIYRGNLSHNGVAFDFPHSQGTTATPSDQVIEVFSSDVGYVTFASYAGDTAISTRSFTPTETTENNITSGEFYVKTKVYTAEDTPSDITVGMNDVGNNNILTSFPLRLKQTTETTEASFVNASTFGTTSTITSFTIDTPSGAQTGDVLILAVIVGDDVVNTPSGWATLQTGVVGATNSRTFVFGIKLTSTPPTNYNVSVGSGTAPVAVMGCYRGANFEGTTQSINTASANIVAPSITSSGTNRRLLCIFARDDNTGAVTVPGSMTQRASSQGGTGGGTERKVILADEAISSAGATGTRTATSSGSTASFGVSILL